MLPGTQCVPGNFVFCGPGVESDLRTGVTLTTAEFCEAVLRQADGGLLPAEIGLAPFAAPLVPWPFLQ